MLIHQLLVLDEVPPRTPAVAMSGGLVVSMGPVVGAPVRPPPASSWLLPEVPGEQTEDHSVSAPRQRTIPSPAPYHTFSTPPEVK